MCKILKLAGCFVMALSLAAACIGKPAHDLDIKAAAASLSEAAKYQILLDRVAFSPGSIDGKWGKDDSRSFRALRAFQRTNQMDPTGKPGDEVIKALQGSAKLHLEEDLLTSYTISEKDTKGPFADKIPDDWKKLSEMDSLSYTSVEELLGERFHTDPAFLSELNKNAQWTSGSVILVPNVEPFLVPGSKEEQEAFWQDKKSSSVIVSGEDESIKVMSSDNKIMFYAPITPGSKELPLPDNTLTIKAFDVMPKYYFSPDVIKDSHTDKRLVLPSGPNSPVGIVWMDLSKDGYGIHGTAEPEQIGYAASHGCVRLTNWDAAKVAKLVKRGTVVKFENTKD